MNGWLALAVVSVVLGKVVQEVLLAYMNHIYGPKRTPSGRFTK